MSEERGQDRVSRDPKGPQVGGCWVVDLVLGNPEHGGQEMVEVY